MKLRNQGTFGGLFTRAPADIEPLINPNTPGAADVIETVAQQIHSQRHRAGTASVCGGCRELAVIRLTPRTTEGRINYLEDQVVALFGVRAQARRLGRDYGRASHTIHALRAENALLREGVAEHHVTAALLDEARNERDELHQALDERRPAPDPEKVALLLRDAWFRPQGAADLGRPSSRWIAVAETAIDHVRGLWPLAQADVTALDAEADRLLDMRACAACGDHTHTLSSADLCDGCEAEETTRGPETSPGASETVHTPAASWAGESPAPGDTTRQLAQRADTVLEELATALGRRSVPDTPWDTLPEQFRDIYRAYVDVVINTGWRPPLTALIPATRRPVVAQVLTDHELLADDTCRCGKWAGIAWDVDIPKPSMWHAEHVAEQLLGLGVLA